MIGAPLLARASCPAGRFLGLKCPLALPWWRSDQSPSGAFPRAIVASYRPCHRYGTLDPRNPESGP
eukprot:11110585-Heterocapsa_arctica.AAC.1